MMLFSVMRPHSVWQAWLKNKNMVSQQEYAGAEDALKWAARTYVVAAIGAVASMLYWALQVFGRRD